MMTLPRVAGHSACLWALLIAVAAAAPALVYPELLTQAVCIALFASGFNLLFGFGGMLSFGHAALFGGGAYAAGLLLLNLGPHPFFSLIAASIGGAALGAAMGAIAVRRSGVYLAMITLALAEVVYFVAVQAPITGGEDGLQGIPRGKLWGVVDLENSLAMYFVALAVYVVAIAALRTLVASPYGLSLKAIRENEARAVSLGYRVNRYKIIAFAVSGWLSGAAGALNALNFHFASLDDLHWHKSGEVILAALLGGAGTLLGPSVGALMVVVLTDSLAAIGEWVNFVLGALFVFCVLMFRRGILGEAISFWERRIARPRRSPRLPSPAGAQGGASSQTKAGRHAA